MSKDITVLGIETSCDETAAAVVRSGKQLLSNVIASQIAIHAKYGGVVPEVAARSHIEVINTVIEKAVTEAGLIWNDIDCLAVTYGPGLIGSLLMGVEAVKALSLAKSKPVVAVNHLEGHVYANWIDRPSEPELPALCLIVSGGHSQLVLMRDHMNFEIVGSTRDDAAGEAFDKVAKLLGLGFPGGPAIDKAAEKGNAGAFKLPDAKLGKDSLEFSFSGLKTAVLRLVQELEEKGSVPVNDVAASFRYTVVDTLISKTQMAIDRYQPKTVMLSGGVAANDLLRKRFETDLKGVKVTMPPKNLCTDNGAMIAAASYWHALNNDFTDLDKLIADSSLRM